MVDAPTCGGLAVVDAPTCGGLAVVDAPTCGGLAVVILLHVGDWLWLYSYMWGIGYQ